MRTTKLDENSMTSMQTSKQSIPSSSELSVMTAKQIAALKKQLQIANARLLAIEREGRKLKDDIAALAALLKRVDSGVRTQ
jgi:predicted  nucleic acid-binding Zn-ribbon protein